MKHGLSLKNYFAKDFTSDLKAGFITAVVALPLAIGFAIASGVHPVMGLYTAVIAGFLGSLIGGSKFSITGPTGAMTVLILSTLNKYGIEGILLAGLLAGIMQFLLGVVKVGKFVKFIPLPIISGFTAGIGVLIFIGQIPNSLGIKIQSHEFVGDTFKEIAGSISSTNMTAVLITLLTFAILMLLPKFFSRIKFLKAVPASIIALILTTVFAYFYASKTGIPTVGEIPSSLPSFKPVNFDWQLVKDILPASFTIALLGSIEALMCAVVSDGMTGTRHNSNRELIAQGIVNMIVPFFGGIPATAAVARTAVNIREGARTRIAGMIHAVILLLTILFFAPVAQYIPKSFLAGMLMFVSLKMINVREIWTILHLSKSETLGLLITLSLTVLTDLVFAVEVGFVFAVILVFIRLINMIQVTHHEDIDSSHSKIHLSQTIQNDKTLNKNVAIYILQGPFFFGAMNVFDSKVSEQIDTTMPHIIIDMEDVPFVDSTAAFRLLEFIHKRSKTGKKVYLTCMKPDVKKRLLKNQELKEFIHSNNTIFPDSISAINYLKIHLEKE